MKFQNGSFVHVGNKSAAVVVGMQIAYRKLPTVWFGLTVKNKIRKILILQRWNGRYEWVNSPKDRSQASFQISSPTRSAVMIHSILRRPLRCRRL